VAIISPKMWATSAIKNYLKYVNNHPMGEDTPQSGHSAAITRKGECTYFEVPEMCITEGWIKLKVEPQPKKVSFQAWDITTMLVLGIAAIQLSTIVSCIFLLPTMLTQCWRKTTWGIQMRRIVLCRELHLDDECLGGLYLHPIKYPTLLFDNCMFAIIIVFFNWYNPFV
jgi:hypothetical protein